MALHGFRDGFMIFLKENKAKYILEVLSSKSSLRKNNLVKQLKLFVFSNVNSLLLFLIIFDANMVKMMIAMVLNHVDAYFQIVLVFCRRIRLRFKRKN